MRPSILDADSDGDPDFIVAALGEDEDRLLVNDLAGSGTFVTGPATGLLDTPGTLGIALADLNGDRKLDVVQSQGELAEPEKVWVGDEIAADTAKPVVLAVDPIGDGADGPRVRARVHDNKSPNRRVVRRSAPKVAARAAAARATMRRAAGSRSVCSSCSPCVAVADRHCGSAYATSPPRSIALGSVENQKP